MTPETTTPNQDPGRPERPTEGPVTDPTGEDRARARTWAMRAGVLLGSLVVLYGALAIAFRLLLDPARVSSWVEPRLEAAINRDVELEGARPVFLPALGVDLTGLRIENLSDFEGAPLAEVDRIRLRVAILPLLTGEVRVDEVHVESPSIRLAVDPEGTTNYGDLMPASRDTLEGPREGPLRLEIRDLRVSGGRIEYSSAPDTVFGALVGIRSSASLGRRADGAWSVELETESEGLELRHPALGGREVRLEGPSLTTRAAVGAEGDWLELGEGDLRVGDAAFQLTGRIDDLAEPVRRLDLSLRADGLALERLATVLPDTLAERFSGTPTGTVQLDITARGEAGPDLRPSLQGRVEVSGAGLEAEDGTSLARSVDGRIHLSDDSVRIEELAGTVLGGPFSLSAVVEVDSLLPVRGRVEMRPDLEGVQGLAELPEGVRVSGRVDLVAGFAGYARLPADVGLDGELGLRQIRARHPRLGVPVELDEARIALVGRSASWSGVAVTLGDETAELEGALDDPLAVLAAEAGRMPTLRLRLTSSRLTLERILPPRGDPEMTYGRIAFAHLGGRRIDGRTAEEVARSEGFARPDSLPLRTRIDVAVDTLIAEPYQLSDARIRVEAGPALLEVPEASFGLFGGRVATTLRAALGAGAHQPFDVTLSVDGAQARDFLARTSPLGRRIRGALTMELRSGGALDTLMLPVAASLGGDGSFDVRDGGMDQMPLTELLARTLSLPGLAAPTFRDWCAGFDVEGGRLFLRDGRLATEVGELLFGGTLGLDGSLDLGLRLAVSGARLDTLALGRAGMASGVVGRLSGDAPLHIGLRLGGTVSEPTLAPEAALATGSFRDALAGEVRERVGAIRDSAAARLDAERRAREERARERAREARDQLEDRARGFLRGFLGPGDTTAGDTLEPAPVPDADTAAADTTPPDTVVPPDTAGPDTIPPDTEIARAGCERVG